jgi:feruloyl-CoA synthase
MVSAWGSTETSPLITQVHFAIDRAGVIGVPAPGCELAFVPSGHKLEMRVKGPNVTPGMWKRGGGIAPLATDERGFYAMGDAGKLADPEGPSRGVIFDGRTAENFKLASGTWVHVGELRIAALSACAPLVQDAVVTGPDREEVGLMLFVTPDAARLPALHDRLRAGLAAFNKVHAGNSARIARALVLREPANIDAGEITDKGYLNQRALLENRANDVARLYEGGDDIIVVV